MRVAPVGWFAADEAEALELAEAQAAVTHNHPDAITAAQAIALTILLARNGEPMEALRERILTQFGYDLTPEIALKPGIFDVSAAGTVPSALAAVFESRNWEDAVRTAVALGGDADTLGCIAGAVAEAVHGLPSDIARTARAYLTEDLDAVVTQFAPFLPDRD
jgi:ADP-ribosylglycohydrolase